MGHVQDVDLGKIARIAETLDGPQLIGQCFAYREAALLQKMEETGVAWHTAMLRQAIVGLWHQRSRRPTVVGYHIGGAVSRLFYLNQREQFPDRFFGAVRNLAGYMECGSSYVPHETFRPLSYWEWPCTCVALWPVGERFDPAAPRVVDTGNVMSYFSYPASDHDESIPVEVAGPEYVQVPTEDVTAFISPDGHAYWNFNRWMNFKFPEALSR